jgi:DNA-directed RNA polymerase specialized sigma24 family protein
MEISAETLMELNRFFERAKRICRRRGLNEQDAEDCAAEVRLRLLLLLQRGGTLSTAYFESVLQGCLADFWEQQRATVPLEEVDARGGGKHALRHRAGCAHRLRAAPTC